MLKLVNNFLAKGLKNMHRDFRDQGNELWEKVDLDFSGMKKMSLILKNTGYGLTNVLEWVAAKYLAFSSVVF